MVLDKTVYTVYNTYTQLEDEMRLLIDNKSILPIYDQIYTQIKAHIISGSLQTNDPLPSIRSLAKDLRISVITTKRAYDELEKEATSRIFRQVHQEGNSKMDSTCKEYLQVQQEGKKENRPPLILTKRGKLIQICIFCIIVNTYRPTLIVVSAKNAHTTHNTLLSNKKEVFFDHMCKFCICDLFEYFVFSLRTCSKMEHVPSSLVIKDSFIIFLTSGK